MSRQRLEVDTDTDQIYAVGGGRSERRVGDLYSFRVFVASDPAAARSDTPEPGLVPRPPHAGDTKFLRQDGTWAVPSGGGGSLSDGDYGDITVSGSGTVMSIDAGVVDTAELAANGVTYAKLQDMTTDRLLGRDTAGSGDPEELTVSGGIEFTGAGGIQRSALTGDVTAGAGSNSTTISSSVITTAARTVLDDATVAAMLATLGGVPTTRTLTGATPILVAGDNSAHDLSADRTISLDTTAIRGVSSGNTGAIWTDDLPAPGHATFVDPSQEFMNAQSAGGWTNAWDIGSIGVSKAIGERGIAIDIPTGGGGQKAAGYYHSTYPTGDYCLACRISAIHPSVAFSYTAVALMQDPSSSTGDAYLAGLFGQNAAGDPFGHVGEISAYNAGALTSRWTSTAGWPSVYVVMRVGGTHVTTWVGSDATHLAVRDFDRTLGYTPTKIGLVGWSYTRTTRLYCPYIRIISDTYPGSTYAVPPVISGARFFGL